MNHISPRKLANRVKNSNRRQPQKPNVNWGSKAEEVIESITRLVVALTLLALLSARCGSSVATAVHDSQRTMSASIPTDNTIQE